MIMAWIIPGIYPSLYVATSINDKAVLSVKADLQGLQATMNVRYSGIR